MLRLSRRRSRQRGRGLGPSSPACCLPPPPLERKLLLPAAGTLAELVAGVREAAAHRLWTLPEGLTTPEQAAALGRLLEVEPDARVSRLELPRADQGQRP
jgi:hypothetical protein